ncbi:NAD-glutamate dehydrogenase [Marinimicrobium alkaliphilum]|uniref:NAD-glutamate dehydrogenase n=1 Tax=Marinimicrobium alkaliphilum TaxID=2202654 RepID=UPI000DB905F9|nr:NAD-glutamate dehydrogenase [Marinimicrobium alkaliphilum]
MENLVADTRDSESLVAQLDAWAKDQLDAELSAPLRDFCRLFFNRYPLDEVADRPLNDIFGALYSHWRSLSQFDGSKPRIQAFNPSLENDGWVCPHTLLVVVQRDMPFLVDSIRIELNRRNIAIHRIKSTVMQVERTQGEIQYLGDPNGDGSHPREALVVMEINRESDLGELHALEKSLRAVLKDVVQVVGDFKPMTDAVKTLRAGLALAQDNQCVQQVEESQAFLDWLLDDHFTFLGYSEYDFEESDKGRCLQEQRERRLGLFRKQAEAACILESDFDEGMSRFYLTPQVVAFSKSNERSRIHRQAYPDYIVVKRVDQNGDVCGEARLLGLYTSRVYTASPKAIPLIREKVSRVFERTGLNPNSHDGKALQQVLETFPRDELFQSTSNQLYDTVNQVAAINERYQVRLFMRPDIFGKFVNAIVYIPRDVFNTRLREKVQQLIADVLHAEEYEFTTYYSESILARVHMVFKVDPNRSLDYDPQALEAKVVALSRSWEDHLYQALHEAHGEEQGSQLARRYADAFPSAYREHFEARIAVQDIDFSRALGSRNDIAMSFYQPLGAQHGEMRFKILHLENALELSDVIPILEHLGLRVLAEHPYQIRPSNGARVWLHDFQLSYHQSVDIDIDAVRHAFQDAFAAIWRGYAESDAFNRLVLGARLNWQEVAMLRAYAAYMRQTLFAFSEQYIANALLNQSAITRNLVALFKARFDPRLNQGRAKDRERIERLTKRITDGLEGVANLNEDRILRRYLALMTATLRTNYFQSNADGSAKSALALKLSPRTIPDLPEPRPLYEVFVYSPRVEAVHLRAGRVARGGLRWSDRLQDYRTEVLGLVKAQHVKNSVIVPGGAKGGFVCKRPPVGGDRDALRKEAIVCYQSFIRSLLDVTDNLIEGEVVPPKDVVRHDNDDPYLVVAADKGTATFSDIANEISNDYNFWLGDAFASGGSQGYDHKGMGITARGAWVAVQRHFMERDLNIQAEDFTVVGIGDMGGDVFGNGMLLSEHICLTAAFNHLHIFIDPNPDSAASFVERQRLFNTPGSSWDDYDKSLISEGGGVFSRDAKSIDISPQMQECFAIEESRLTPNELINRLLKAPVDLLWNGGIGTYVKSESETHAQVGDKANDSLRVNGNELRCKVIGEGGNLGMTQLGRIEYALNGGACNTDFIDNAAGVDTSDHEVNIKILLNEVMVAGDMTEKQRNQLLREMTEDVAVLVLENNYQQSRAISMASAEALHRGPEYRRLINTWHSEERLDRVLEFLPDEETLQERESQGQGLTRPELAVLVSYAKVILKEDLARTNLADDPALVGFAELAFPRAIRERFQNAVHNHKLRRELVATQIANDMVNNMGISFAQRLLESTGAPVSEVARAYVTARGIYALDDFTRQLKALDFKVPGGLQTELMSVMMRRVRRATRWFLRNRRSQLNPQAEIAYFHQHFKLLAEQLSTLLDDAAKQEWDERTAQLTDAGVPEALARNAGAPGYLYSGLGLVESARQSGAELEAVASIYFGLADQLGLYRFTQQLTEVPVTNHWQARARETLLDDLESQLRSLVVSLARSDAGSADAQARLERWRAQQAPLIKRWHTVVDELDSAGHTDYAMFSVALRELLDLVQASQHAPVTDDV